MPGNVIERTVSIETTTVVRHSQEYRAVIVAKGNTNLPSLRVTKNIRDGLPADFHKLLFSDSWTWTRVSSDIKLDPPRACPG